MSEPGGDTWEIYDDSLPFAGATYGPHKARMAIVGLGGGALLVVSPAVPVSPSLLPTRWP